MPIEMTRNDSKWTVDVDGVTHTLRPGDITPRHAKALRQQSEGAWKVPSLFEAVGEGIGPEELVGLIFLARQQDAPATYAECEAQVENATTITLDYTPDEADPEDEAPEA